LPLGLLIATHGANVAKAERPNFKVAWQSVRALKVCKTVLLIIPIHKKKDKGKYSNCRRISFFSPPRKAFAKCLDRRRREISETKLMETQCDFRHGRSNANQIFTLANVRYVIRIITGTAASTMLLKSTERKKNA